MHRPFCVTYNFFHRFVRKNAFLFYFACIGWGVVPDYMRTPVHTCRTVQRYASHWRSAYLHTVVRMATHLAGMKVSEGGGNVDAEVVPSQAVFLTGPHTTPFLTHFSEI